MGIRYYVQPYFEQRYGKNAYVRMQVEDQVFDEYITQLKSQCSSQRNARKTKIDEAKAYRGQSHDSRLRNAFEMPLNHCEELNDLYARI